MSRSEIYKELNTLSKRIFALEQKLSQYFEDQHNKSSQSISETESAIIDLEIGLEEVKSKIEEVMPNE